MQPHYETDLNIIDCRGVGCFIICDVFRVIKFDFLKKLYNFMFLFIW